MMHKELSFFVAALLLVNAGAMPVTNQNHLQQTSSRTSNRTILEAILKDIERATISLPSDGGSLYVPEKWDACAKKIFVSGIKILQIENENNDEIGKILRNIEIIWNEDSNFQNCQMHEVKIPQFLEHLKDFLKFLIATGRY